MSISKDNGISGTIEWSNSNPSVLVSLLFSIEAKTVNVYRLVTKDSIEEKIMSLQEKKIALSNAIVNTDNSSLFSMGTDRLLDIFTCRSDSQQNESSKAGQGGDGSYNLDALVESYKSEYSALSVNDFLQALKK